MLTLTTFTKTRAPLIAEILPLFKLHSRITNTDEDALLNKYAAAAVAAAENYLMRDVYPTVCEWTGGIDAVGGAFVVRRGCARVLTVQTGGVDVDPAGYVVVTSADPKTWGFEIRPLSTIGSVTIHAELGFDTYAEMPDDLQAFILQAAGAFYEVREIANYGGGSAGVSSPEFLPLYLLDTWANLTYA